MDLRVAIRRGPLPASSRPAWGRPPGGRASHQQSQHPTTARLGEADAAPIRPSSDIQTAPTFKSTSRREGFALVVGVCFLSSCPKAAGQTAGLTLEGALATTLDVRRRALDWSQQPSQLPSSEELRAVAAALSDALPVVGAEAAYTQRDWRLRLRGSPIDSMVGVFAFLDRAADGASELGPNRNISIKDIERLEYLEALTTEALDAMDRLVVVSRSPPAEVVGSQSLAAKELRGLVDSLDRIITEVPQQAISGVLGGRT